MRSLAVMVVVALLACSSGKPPGTNDPETHPDPDAGVDTPPPPVPAFEITSPTVDVYPNTEITYCYYFRTSNAADQFVKQWSSHMTPGVQDLIVYLTPYELYPPSTLSTTDCGISHHPDANWTYAAQTPDADMRMPLDDGQGHPVGQPVKAYQPGFLQMHFVNTTASVIHAHVELGAFTHDAGLQVTPAGSYVTYTYASPVFVASGSATNPASATFRYDCSVIPGGSAPPLTFFAVTTHTHKQGVHTYIRDGAATVFESTSWLAPGTRTWDAAPFYTFASGALTYQCDYLNPNSYSITAGDDPVLQEQCMAIGFYFPATGIPGQFCLNGAPQR